MAVFHKQPSAGVVLPDASRKSMDFLDSSYFQKKNPMPQLPSPGDVMARSPSKANDPSPPPVRYEKLNLIVKFGSKVNVSEGINLWLVKQLFGDRIPCPEVYGWRVEGIKVFIYMELIQGITLKDSWALLSDNAISAICMQLHDILALLRQAEHPSGDIFIGSVDRQLPKDKVFQGWSHDGAFNSLAEFNDWFCGLPFEKLPLPKGVDNPWRNQMPDSGKILLTHGDLHRANIIISSEKSATPRVLAIVDWAHAGWYPDWWEYCKMIYTSSYGEIWREQCIPKILSQREDVSLNFWQIIMAMGSI